MAPSLSQNGVLKYESIRERIRNPETIEAETSGQNRDSLPEWSIITYQFPATVARQAVKLFWYDGGKLPNRELFQGFPVNAAIAWLSGPRAR